MGNFLECCIRLFFLFIYVGVDVFGLWEIIICKIRGGLVNSKCWGILFICLICCVVYIELVEDMLLFIFINVLRRFVVIWGKVVEFCFDRGINFVGSIDVLGIVVVNVESLLMKNVFINNGCIWIFNFFYMG